MISPTGVDCISPEHLTRQLKSGRLERAGITAFESVAARGDYIAADITAAYNSTRYSEPGAEAKVSLVTRQFRYLRRERAFVVFDRVETTRSDCTPKFLLHALSKPLTASERQLIGEDAVDGILATSDRAVTVSGERGALTQRVLLPERSRTLKIGGPHSAGFVQTGPDLTGVNLEPDPGKGGTGARPKGLWRVEVEPIAAGKSHRFLNVLLPKLKDNQRFQPEVELLNSQAGVVAARIGGSVTVKARDAARLDRVELDTASDSECWVLDARPGAEYQLDGRRWKASAEGVLVLPWLRGKRTLRLVSAGR